MNFYTEDAKSASAHVTDRAVNVSANLEITHDGVLDLTCRPASKKTCIQSNEKRTEKSDLTVKLCSENPADIQNAETGCIRQSITNVEDGVFNLASEAGQEHLRELNQEIKALNEQGSPKLSLLHGPKRKRKRAQKSTDTEDAGDSAAIAPKKRNLKRKMLEERGKKTTENSRDNLLPGNGADKVVEPHNDIDRLLEEKALKANLTAINVKNILKYVVTNEHVLSMVQNSILEEDDMEAQESKLLAAVYEPKLTRSKAKELIEKQATVPWPISPFKKETTSNSKKIIELSFSESESSSDEEYDPDKDKQLNLDESLNTSQTIELESAMLTIVESAMPSDNIHNEILEAREMQDSSEDSEDTIALRTRSKLPLNDTPLECIEAQFIAPDITTDMYDSECDDEEWKGFLWEFLKPLDSTSVDNVDDDANDPEYDFLAEEDIPDREDFRDDRAVKISKKEIQELVAEFAEDELADEDEDVRNRRLSCSSALFHARETEDLSSAFQSAQVETLFNMEMRLQLDEQMRKHIQLLTQMFLFSYQEPGLNLETEMSKVLLFELYDLNAKNIACYSRPSAFSACNLKDAIDILTSNSLSPDNQTQPPLRSKGKNCSSNLSDAGLMLLAQSKVFIYPELLPTTNFQPPMPYKAHFTEAEDNLLAMGLEQFLSMSTSKKEQSCWSLIKEHMIPVKSVKQISIRVKNLKSNKWPENPVKIFYRTKQAPIAQRTVEKFNPDHVLPLYKQNLSILPQYLQIYITEKAKQMCFPNRTLIVPIKPILNTFNAENAKLDVTVSPISDKIKSPVSLLDVSENINQERHSKSSLTSVCSSNHVGRFPSSWKHVSPILKKYSPKRLRKTGGNLTKSLSHVKKIFPKPVLLPPKVPFCGTNVRLLASKANKPVLLPKPSSGQLSPPNLELSKISNLPAEPKSPHPLLNESKKYEKTSANTSNQSSNVPSVKVNVAGSKGVEKDLMKPTKCDDNGKNDSIELIISNGEESVQEIPITFSNASEPQGSESDIEAEMFDDGEDTADDDVVDTQTCDNEDDLAALMAASTTIKSIPRQRHNMLKKNKKVMRDRKDLLAMLDYDKMEGEKLKEEQETAYAQAYLLKVKDAVGSNGDIFEEFLSILHEFSQSEANVIQLYKNICNLLKDFPDLCEEFVIFLLPEQAQECGKFMEYLQLTKLQVFLKKLEVHFGKHPHHIQKIVKVLTQLHAHRNRTIDDIKSSVLPLLRGQQHIIEEFLQLFPDEAPPESLMTDFEELHIPGEDDEIGIDGDGFEVIDLPDSVDEYGGQDCMCTCHLSSEKPKMQNRLQHCIGCGIKFIDGRIFLQAGKALKPCQIVYLSTDNEPIASDKNATKIQTSTNHGVSEVSKPNTKSASPASSISSLSPTVCKDSDEEREARVSHDKHISSRDVAKNTNIPLLDTLEHVSKGFDNAGLTEAAIILPGTVTNLDPSVPEDFSLLRHVICPQTTDLEMIHPNSGHGKSTIDVTSPKNTVAKIYSREPSLAAVCQLRNDQCINTMEMPVSKCHEESATDLDDKIDSPSSTHKDAKAELAVPARNHKVTKEGQVVVLWTREFDRILLQMCQQLSPNMETFSIIATKLMKTVEEVATRFQALMALYSQQDNLSLSNISNQN